MNLILDVPRPILFPAAPTSPVLLELSYLKHWRQKDVEQKENGVSAQAVSQSGW